MKTKYLAAMMIPALVLTGCARMSGENSDFRAGPTAPSQQIVTANAAASTDLTAFVGAETVALLSAKERAEATSAQYYALQFGRPGAPRSWEGDTGASGKVSVGPYVRVNSLDCRDFSHLVTVGGRTYEREGTACREPDGSWDVAAS